jgi:hypothetical protein
LYEPVWGLDYLNLLRELHGVEAEIKAVAQPFYAI